MYALLRIGTVVVVIPCWILLGLFTFGWFWPPQLREAVFTSSVFKHTTDTEKEEMLRKTQIVNTFVCLHTILIKTIIVFI
jgi:hypothetical protein